MDQSTENHSQIRMQSMKTSAAPTGGMVSKERLQLNFARWKTEFIFLLGRSEGEVFSRTNRQNNGHRFLCRIFLERIYRFSSRLMFHSTKLISYPSKMRLDKTCSVGRLDLASSWAGTWTGRTRGMSQESGAGWRSSTTTTTVPSAGTNWDEDPGQQSNNHEMKFSHWIYST